MCLYDGGGGDTLL